jgi:hypothetical protein
MLVSPDDGGIDRHEPLDVARSGLLSCGSLLTHPPVSLYGQSEATSGQMRNMRHQGRGVWVENQVSA